MTKVTKFKKKPTTIEAVEFTGKNGKDIVAWVRDNGGEIRNGGSYLKINTWEGVMTVSKSAMVVRGIAGEFYPVDKEIFKALHVIPKDFKFLTD